MIIREPEVLNVSNLMLHNYGESIFIGSVDIDVDENLRAGEITALSRRIISMAGEAGIKLTSVGVNGVRQKDIRTDEIWDRVIGIALKYKSILRVSSLNADFGKKEISFYVVQDLGAKDSGVEMEQLQEELQAIYPDMTISIFNSIDL